jgi:pilus assembly protein Flp/PilA
MSSFLRRICRDDAGATAIEYGLIAAMIVIAMISALIGFAGESIAMYEGVSEKVSEASS